VVAGDKRDHSSHRLLAAGTIAVASLAAGVITVMIVSGAPQAQEPEPVRIADAQAAEGTRYAEAAPKQQAPTPKQQPQPQAQAPKPAQIDRNGVLILIRTALLALDQANKTGNYTVLRDLGSPDFQVNTAARLAEIFGQQRRDNIDLSGVAVIDPRVVYTPPPPLRTPDYYDDDGLRRH